MKFTDDYEKREWLGREALKELKEIYPEYFKYELRFTTEKYAYYDAFYFIIDVDTQKLRKRVWIEIKIRDETYDDYVLELKKLNQLIKKRDEMFLTEDDVIFLYLNYTPNETIIWNITKIKEEGEVKNKVMNKATSTSRKDKKDKKIYYLKPSDGKRLDYVLNEKQLLRKYDNYLLDKVKEMIKKKPGLEDILFG